MKLIKTLLRMLWQSDDLSSGRYAEEKLILELAIVCTLLSPWLAYLATLPYRGSLPPVAPLIKTSGKFVLEAKYQSVTTADLVGLRSADGKIYPLQYIKEQQGIRDYLAVHGIDSNFYVEGFILLDGQGEFWPTLVTTPSGDVMLSESTSYAKLIRMRSVTFLLPALYMVAVVFWCISIRNALRFDMEAI